MNESIVFLLIFIAAMLGGIASIWGFIPSDRVMAVVAFLGVAIAAFERSLRLLKEAK